MQFTSSSENYASSIRNSPSRWTKDENKEYGYKKTASYNYSSTGGGNAGQINSTTTTTSANNNVDQLDVLLEDLKNERRISKEKDYGLPSSSYIVNEHEKSTSTIPLLSEISSTTKKTTKHSEPIYSSNKYYNEYQRKEVVNEELPIVVRNTTKSTLDKEIDDIALPSSILPPPGTKVTTTVRTYTYEIPAGENTNTDYSSTLNRSHIVKRSDDVTDMSAYELTRNKLPAASSKYHSESYTSSSTTEKLPPPVLPAATTSYHAESYSSSSNTDRLPAPLPVGGTYHSESYATSSKAEPYPVPRSVPVGTNQIYELRETHEVSSSLVPQPRNQNIHNTVVYNVSSSQRSPSEPRSNGILPMPTENVYGRTVNKTITTNIDRSLTPVPVSVPVPAPLPPHPETNLSSYHYSSTTTRSGGTGGPRVPDYGGPRVPDYGSPQGKPAPFPVERADYQMPNEQTPTRVDDLMQSFESSDIRSTEVDSPHRKHEVDTSTASSKQQHVPSVNRAGKDIFYPPGHELMLSKHQEMSAASQGGGRWAKGSGNYEYEAGAKSSSKSKSGATMVPVCLPLCCAMPCSIM